jgi:arginine-tRNA-protein transferase
VTDQSFRFPRFFVTTANPCPYLPGKIERKLFAELRGHEANEMNDALSRIGFRRSQNVVYRPSCDGCNACVSVRVIAGKFRPNRTQARLMKRNADLEVRACEPWATPEQYALLRRYLDLRHPRGGMSRMDSFDYADMVERSPVDTIVVEYRLPPAADGTPGRLVACALTDRHSDGLSMVYSFYDPELADRGGLGTYLILDHITRAASAGLAHVYLGFWIDGCDRMSYKTAFQPLERHGPQGWVRLPR